MMELSNVFQKTLDAYKSGNYNIISNMGGTRSGKTYSTLQLIYLIATGKSQNLMISVVSRTMSHLKRGCLRDWENILDSVDRAGLVDINLTDRIYIFTNNNRVEFFSADDTGKMHGAQRDMIFVNEANFIEESKIKQLFVRTSGVKFIDYNPSGEFWVEQYRLRPDFIEIHSTYLDNNFLSKEQVAEIESNRRNERWWTIYGQGQSYARQGLCYPNVRFEADHQFTHPTYGLDFGYYDPTACVKVEIEGDHIYVQQVFYGRGMSVQDIKKYLMETVPKRSLIIGDNASPQIIRELQNDGWKVKPCRKGPNSVFDGIQLCNNFIIHCILPTKQEENGQVKEIGGVNLRSEFLAYSYEQDSDGNWLDIPEDKHNHCLDAFRYVVQYLRTEKKSGTYQYVFI